MIRKYCIFKDLSEPQGEDDEEEALAPMPDLKEYEMILQHLAIEQEQDHLNELRHNQNSEPEILKDLQASPPVTPENEENCWVDDPLTSEDEFDSQQAILEVSLIGTTCNAIVLDDSVSEALSTKATDSHITFGSISSGATSSHVTSTEISPSQFSSPETVTSELNPLPMDHLEEAEVEGFFFNENPVNWSQIPDLIGDV